MKKKTGETGRTSSERVYRRVGGILPDKLMGYFGQKLRFSGNKDDTKVWLGMRILLALCAGTILMTLYLIIYNPIATVETGTNVVVLFLGGFLAVITLVYIRLYLVITDRTSQVEKVLPDFLLLTASNLRAGMTPFAAFISASKPEFGPLNDEVRSCAAKAGGTTSLVDAMNEIGRYFDSPVLQRAVNLFAKGIRSGGQLAKLLTASAEEVRKIQDLREELATSTRTYVIFLGFIIVMVMPFLLSVSTQFLTVFLTLQNQNANPVGVNVPGNLPSFSGKVLITLDQMLIIAISILVMTSLLASGLLGIIIKGKALYGVKYFPIFAIASIIFFFIANGIVGGFLSHFGS